MADGMFDPIPSECVTDPHALGFVAAMCGKSLWNNPFVPLTRKSIRKCGQWREGWFAYSSQYITDALKEVFWDVGQMRNPATQEYFEEHGSLPEPLAEHLRDRCVRP